MRLRSIVDTVNNLLTRTPFSGILEKHVFQRPADFRRTGFFGELSKNAFSVRQQSEGGIVDAGGGDC